MSAVRKLIIILNGVSRKKKKFYHQILPYIQSEFDVTVWETQHQDDAIELASNAIELNPFGILAAGGDGTLNQMLNGVLSSKSVYRCPVGIIPLGTGNDFARLCNVLPTAQSIISKINVGSKATDIGVVQCKTENGESVTRYFLNVASIGMGPEVVRRLFKSNRILGPTLTYAKASIETFLSNKPEEVLLKSDNWEWSGKMRVVAIGNGQSFGGGLFVAPDALPDDGLLNTFIAGEIPLFKFLKFLQQIKSTKKIQDKLIHYKTNQSLSIASSKKLWIETEGELAGILPATIKVIRNGIQFFR